MSVKRRATTDLNHENWDQEEKDEEEMGTFKVAPEDVLEKRVIKIAKRRSQNADGTKKAVFSGFGGFNKTQPSSFDFLANLTNGSKTNTTSATTTDSVPPSTNITSKPFGSMSSSNIFTSPASSVPAKPSFGKPTTESSSSVFGVPTSSIAQSIFTASKADSTVNDNPFKTQVTTNSFNSKQPEVSSSQVSSTIFGTASSSSNNKSLFAPSSSTAFQIQPVSSASSQLTNTAVDAKTENTKESNTNSEKIEGKKLTYYSKLKGLNESVSEWIKKHVDETPLCILTPIFKDYEKYLKEIQDEYNNKKEEEKNSNNNDSKKTENQAAPIKSNTTPTNNMLGSPSFTTASSNTPKSIFAVKSTQSGNFSFGFTSSASTNTSAGFSFLNSTQSTATTTSPFAGSNSAANTNDKPAFSFGTDKPFNFNSNIQVKENTDKPSENNEEEDEPPKVEFTPVVEENSVFDKRCKIFVKKDGNFVDKGVGTLYIKKIEDSEKHQLLVRANTNLGNVLLNMVLSSAIPIQRMGKNNVMLVCIPSPEAKPPPVPILIRVKTSEEADDLLNTLNKYKQ
ncbi:unnamed protein product [Parnassius apollo]|uniref:(apollo) hypothetical protein n=1 Tax=Parnassius apollo TaxID=110799 RepID=A0A8S3YDM4_PARAO|nr:unnamed protein product [Parnassius apollo]